MTSCATHDTTAAHRGVRECHKCPRSGKGDPYCWQKCLGPAEVSNKGIHKISLGGMEAEGEYIYQNLDDDARSRASEELSLSLSPDRRPAPPRTVTATLSVDSEEALRKVLATMLSGLTMKQLCVFKGIYDGHDYATIGRLMGEVRSMSKQAVEKHIDAIRAANPAIGTVIDALRRKCAAKSRMRRDFSQLRLMTRDGSPSRDARAGAPARPGVYYTPDLFGQAG